MATNPFEDELVRFKGQLKAAEKNYFQFSNEAEFVKELDALQTKLHASRRQQNMPRIKGFIEAMTQFGKVIDVFCQTSEVVAFVWGPWKLLLLIGETFSNAFSELLDIYEQLGETIKLLCQAQSLYSGDTHMAVLLSGIYKDILQFHRLAFEYFQKPMLKQIFDATWKTYKTRFNDLIHAIGSHRLLLLGQMTLSEARRTREAEEVRRTQEIAEQENRNRREMYGWLQGSNMKNDHDGYKAVMEEYPNSGRWLLQKREFQKWFDRFPSTPALLWINGIPGAGKTILSSLIIEEAKSLPHKPVVLFFYFRTDVEEKNNFIVLARNLLRQSLVYSPSLLSFFYEKYKNSVEASLTTISDIKELLEVAIRHNPSVYIILDGVDECPRDERKVIAEWFRKLVEGLPPTNTDQVRCLFVSQDDGPARNDFKGITTLKILPGDNWKDICEFSAVWAKKIQEKFELSDEKATEIGNQVSESSQGKSKFFFSLPRRMFLLARLICENLFEQKTGEDVEEELKPGTLPREINKAYERIMVRISQPAAFKHRDNYCTFLLGWLACSKRPLRWQEVQVMKSMDQKAGVIDMKRRQFRTSAKDICGSFIEEHDEGVIDLVHQTAKLYLIKSGYIDPALEEVKLATLCVDYLNLPISQLSVNDVTSPILAGHHVFLEYAVMFWVRHLESGLILLEGDTPLFPTLAESVGKFLELHRQNDTSRLEVSPRNKERFRRFEHFPFAKSLEQAVVSTRRHLGVLGETKPAEIVLDVFAMLQSFRNKLEELIESPLEPGMKDLLLHLYGTKPFKCSRPSCHHFTMGFPTADLRNAHVEKHLRPYLCPLQGCPTSAMGVATERELQRHMREAHDLDPTGTEATDFPTDAELAISDNEMTRTLAVVKQRKKRKEQVAQAGTHVDLDKSREIALKTKYR
ncbi:Vegetative incompatibility protein [Paramyrothecium foliicola]|nr:Vegetative incompatibility protein [Paramyrothecium foliicola]